MEAQEKERSMQISLIMGKRNFFIQRIHVNERKGCIQAHLQLLNSVLPTPGLDPEGCTRHHPFKGYAAFCWMRNSEGAQE